MAFGEAGPSSLPTPRGFSVRATLGFALRFLRSLPVAAYAIVAVAPVAILATYSVFRDEGFTFKPAFDLGNFSTAISGPGDLAVLFKTLTVMWVAAMASVTVAYSVVFAVVVLAPRLLRPIMAAALLALFGGYLVRIFAWRILLGHYGVIASIVGQSGILSGIGNIADSRWAVLLALVNFSVPLCMLPISASFNALDRDILAASYDLGAGTLGTLRRVVLPVTIKGISFAFAIAFVLCAGDYVTPTLLGGVDGFMFGNLITQQFTLTFDWPARRSAGRRPYGERRT